MRQTPNHRQHRGNRDCGIISTIKFKKAKPEKLIGCMSIPTELRVHLSRIRNNDQFPIEIYKKGRDEEEENS